MTIYNDPPFAHNIHVSAANNDDTYDPPNTAAGTSPRVWPVIEEHGTFDTRGLDLEWHIPPPLPSKKEARVKSRWLEKQMKRRGE